MRLFNQNTGRFPNQPSDVTAFIDDFKTDHFRDRNDYHYNLEPFPPLFSFQESGNYHSIETTCKSTFICTHYSLPYMYIYIYIYINLGDHF